MLKEVFTSLKATLYERALSPLAGAFLLVWLGFNWKPVFVMLFGADKIYDRITYVEQHYVDRWQNVGLPFVVTTVLLLLYPLMAAGAFRGRWGQALSSAPHQLRVRSLDRLGCRFPA